MHTAPGVQAGKQLVVLVVLVAVDLTYRGREEEVWSARQQLRRQSGRGSCPPRCTGTPRCTAASSRRPCTGGAGGWQLQKLNLHRPSG